VKKWDYSLGINFTIDYSQYSKEKQTKKKKLEKCLATQLMDLTFGIT